jgi:hypothetical protein
VTGKPGTQTWSEGVHITCRSPESEAARKCGSRLTSEPLEPTAHTFDHGFGRLTVLADAPPPARPLLAVSPTSGRGH